MKDILWGFCGFYYYYRKGTKSDMKYIYLVDLGKRICLYKGNPVFEEGRRFLYMLQLV